MKYKVLMVFVSALVLGSCATDIKPFDENSEWKKLAGGLVFPEGPSISPDGKVYFSNCNGGWIGSYANGEMDTFLLADKENWGTTNGTTFFEGDLYACEYGIGKILKISTGGNIENYATNYKNKNFNRPNDLTFDNNGNLYFTDPKSYGKDKKDGRIFMVRKSSREVVLLQDSLAFPNGIAISPKDKKLYVCESAYNRILRFDITGNGLLANKKVFIELPGGDPDGIDFDTKGNLYVAHYGTGSLFVISSKGEILQQIATPGQRPTNLEFGGKNKKILYLTETETNALYSIPVNTSGL